MCGIIAYTGNNRCHKYLINGLKALEYRGYDSAGVALNFGNNISIIKSVGKVKVLEKEVLKDTSDSKAGIAHTRWATHGKPTTTNSHPHKDCSGSIAIVHNGIIENYLQLKKTLIDNGHNFISETDTEVIAHLIEDNIKKSKARSNKDKIIEAATSTFKKLEGSYAIAIIWKEIENCIVGTRKKNPLVIGVGNNENFLASDTSAFTEYTNKAIFLDDNDIAIITDSEIVIKDLQNNIKDIKINTVSKCNSNILKNDSEHYMLQEIKEQPYTIKDTIKNALIKLDKAFDIDLKEVKDIENITLIGCGTAYYSTMVGSYWMEEYCKIPSHAELASEYKYRKISLPQKTLAIFVTQSGETADTVAALEKAKSLGYKTISICNVDGSTITRLSDYTFFTKCGPEISVASTKAFTAQLAALYCLTLLISKAKKALSNIKINQLLKDLEKIPSVVESALKSENKIVNIAKKYYKKNAFVFLGRNVNYPIALEGALKLKEISYLQSEGFAAGEIKHGPIALIEEGNPVIAVMPKDSLFYKMINACQEVKARGAELIIITDLEGSSLLKDYDQENIIILDKTIEDLTPIGNVVVLQLLAYNIAKLNGREIDQPRNLAKSVTVE